MFDKIWSEHEVADGLLYIDLHLVHEVTSPQAFDGLRMAGRSRASSRPNARDRRPQRPHRRPEAARRSPTGSRRVQVETLERNCESSASRSTPSAPSDRESST